MKKTVFSVMAVLITAFVFLGIKASAKEVKNICVYGDSIPAGYGLESPSENFVNKLAEEYSLKEGESLFNYAVSGPTSGDILGQIQNTLPVFPCLYMRNSCPKTPCRQYVSVVPSRGGASQWQTPDTDVHLLSYSFRLDASALSSLKPSCVLASCRAASSASQE